MHLKFVGWITLFISYHTSLYHCFTCRKSAMLGLMAFFFHSSVYYLLSCYDSSFPWKMVVNLQTFLFSAPPKSVISEWTVKKVVFSSIKFFGICIIFMLQFGVQFSLFLYLINLVTCLSSVCWFMACGPGCWVGLFLVVFVHFFFFFFLLCLVTPSTISYLLNGRLCIMSTRCKKILTILCFHDFLLFMW